MPMAGLDFSADSTRLDLSLRRITGEQPYVQTFHHRGNLVTAKYYPQGETATRDSARVWDGNNGRVLISILSRWIVVHVNKFLASTIFP